MNLTPLDTLLAAHRDGHAVTYADLLRVRQELQTANAMPPIQARALRDLADDLELTGMPVDTCESAAKALRGITAESAAKALRSMAAAGGARHV